MKKVDPGQTQEGELNYLSY